MSALDRPETAAEDASAAIWAVASAVTWAVLNALTWAELRFAIMLVLTHV
jgi:hypothetical protein